MKETNETSMTLTGISEGVKVDLSAMLGTTNAIQASTQLNSGYEIVTKTNSAGLTYKTVNIISNEDSDAANFKFSVYYCQEEGLDEVDLELEYKNIPSGSSLAVNASDSHFTISKRAISGTGIEGKQGLNVGPLHMTITASFWFERPDELSSVSTVTLKMISIEDSGSGPAKKTILEQIVVNLTNQ